MTLGVQRAGGASWHEFRKQMTKGSGKRKGKMKKGKADNYMEKKYNKIKSFEKITTWFIGFRLDWGEKGPDCRN